MSNADKVRKHKDEATRQLAKGRLKEALEELLSVQKLEPQDLANRQKVGDLYSKLGDKHHAIESYQAVAGAYAADGLLLKAIAVCKLILQMDPNHTETQRTLADLYGKKRGDVGTAEMPASMSAAIAKPAPGQKMSASMIRGIPSNQLAAPARTPTGTGGGPLARASTGIPMPPPDVPRVAPHAAEANEIELEEEISTEIEIDEGPPPVITGTAVVSPPPAFSAPPPVVTGTPIAAAPAASWGSAPPPPPPMAAGPAGPAELEEFEMPAADGGGVVEAQSQTVETDFTDFNLDEPTPTKVDLDKLPPIPLFSDLTKNAFIDLLQRMDIKVMSAGDSIIEEGGHGDSFFIIASGSVRVEKTVEGRTIHLATLTDGTFFGEMAVLSDAPRTASVIAETDGELFEISRDTLNAVIEEFPSVQAVMLKFYKQRLLSNLLNSSPIFAPFDKNQRKQLIELFRSREVQPGEFILTEGQKGDGLYLMLSGRCSVQKGLEAAAVEVAQLKEGEVFGEMSLLTRAPVTASIQAITKTIVLRLPRKQFNEVIMTHPQVLEMVSELSAQRQRNNNRLVSTGSSGGSLLV